MRIRRIGSLVAVGFVVLASCSDDVGDDGSANSTVATADVETTNEAERLSGDPIKLGLINTIESPTVAVPSIAAAAKMSVIAINERGGINGRPIELVVCNDRESAEQAAICAQQLLVDEEVVLLVASGSRQSAAFYPVLEQVDSISIGGSGAADDASSPRSFMIAPSINEYAAAPKMFPEGTTSVAWIQSDSPGGQFALTLLEPAIPEGVTLTKIFASTETVDWAPYCLQARDADATVVGIGLSGPATAAAMRACKQQGLTDVTYVVPGLAAGDAFLDSVEPDDNVIVVAGFGGDGLAEYTAELERYADEAGHDVDRYQDQTIAAWLSLRVAADALSKADEISGAAVKRYLDAQTAYETGATPPLDFTTPSPGRAPRIVNRATYMTTVEDGKLVLLSDEPVYAG